MRVYMTDDPAADFDRWDAEQQEWLKRLPHCECCGDPVDEYLWEIEGEFYCDDCAKEKFRRSVEDYLE